MKNSYLRIRRNSSSKFVLNYKKLNCELAGTIKLQFFFSTKKGDPTLVIYYYDVEGNGFAQEIPLPSSILSCDDVHLQLVFQVQDRRLFVSSVIGKRDRNKNFDLSVPEETKTVRWGSILNWEKGQSFYQLIL